jgi:hypothetical protein
LESTGINLLNGKKYHFKKLLLSDIIISWGRRKISPLLKQERIKNLKSYVKPKQTTA